MKENIIWLVIPCYNEKEVLPETSKQLRDIMHGLINKGKISENSKIAFVNDGSKDTTWNIITQLHNEDSIFTGINLAHNRGHQNALLAGLMTAKDYADAAISLDADLQDDVGAIEQFIDKFNEGKDIRQKRSFSSFCNRFNMIVRELRVIERYYYDNLDFKST